MDRWVGRSIDEMKGWMDGWIMNGSKDERLEEWQKLQDEFMTLWVDIRKDEWMVRCMD